MLITGWLGLVLTVLGLGVIGFYLLLGVTIFVTHLIEKRPGRYLIPAPADDPEWAKLPSTSSKRPAGPTGTDEFNPYQAPGSTAYAETMNAEAARLGFGFHGLFKHVKGGAYKTYTALWTSPSREELAVVVWGTLAGINASKTILYTALDDGRFLISADKPTGTETPGLYELAYILGADFARLLARHRERLAQLGRRARPFSAADGLTDYEAILGRRQGFLVETGDAYFIDPDRSAIRSTLKGALKGYGRTLRAPRNVEREGAPPTTGATRPVPAAITWLERACYFTVFMCLFLNSRGRAANTSQQLFRASLFVGSIVGLAVAGVTRAVIKRRAG